MAIKIETITPDQMQRIVDLDEGHFLDVKAIDIAPSKLTRTVAAFANADGGELYVGIDENKSKSTRSWRGFANQEAANAHLQVFESLFPLGQHFSYTFLSCPDTKGLVLYVDVRKTPDIKLTSNKEIYIRRGAQNLPLTTEEEIKRLRLNKGITSFESELVNIDPSNITNSEIVIRFLLEVIPTAEPDVWLKKQQLIVNGKPVVAGVLLFAEEPQAALPKRCAIKVYRYKTKDTEGDREALDFQPITIEGCAYNQIKSAVAQTVEIIEGISTLGASGFERVTYPVETLHEIITNAVLHRDYSIADDVHVRIFDNRIEIESPGTLPGHVTVSNILNERFARNGSIVRIINKFPDPPNKDVGEGLNTAFSAMRRLKLKEPVIQQRDNSVVVIVKHEPLATPEEIIMNYLEDHAEVNNSKGREICFLRSDTAMKAVFNRLLKRNLIEPVPGKRTSQAAYRKVR